MSTMFQRVELLQLIDLWKGKRAMDPGLFLLALSDGKLPKAHTYG